MKVEYKYNLNEQYYIVAGTDTISKAKLTGVKFVQEKILYIYDRVREVEESGIALTLDEAKQRCLKNIDKMFYDWKNEIIKLTEEDINKKGE